MNDEVITKNDSASIDLKLPSPDLTGAVWPCPEDLLDRHKEIENLSPVLLNVTAPLVFSIDAPWGGGKTTFIKLWEKYLKSKSQGKVSIYLNAWESDFAEDPLLPIMSAFDDWFSSGTKKSNTAWDKAKSYLPAIIKSTAVVAAKAATFGGLELDKEYEKLASDLAGNAVGGLVDGFNVKRSALVEFKKQLEKSLDLLPEGQRNLIVFIDELDRCKPTYAIDLLERIKHLFDIERVVFVLAVNSDQLCKSFQGVYGSNFDGKTYLKRFVDMEYQLVIPEHKTYIVSLSKQKDINAYFQRTGGGNELEWIIRIFDWLCASFSYSIRDINHLFTRLRLILLSIPTDRGLDSQILSVMLILRNVNPELYQKYVESGRCTNEVINYLVGDSVVLRDPYGPYGVVAGVMLSFIRHESYYSVLEKHWSDLLEQLEEDDKQRGVISKILDIARSGTDQFGGNIRTTAFERIELIHKIDISNSL